LKTVIIILFLLSPEIDFCQVNLNKPVLDSIFPLLSLKNEYSFVIIGEAHEVKNTHLPEFFIIEKLADMGYKDIYIEGGISEAAILNLYMQTGNPVLLHNTRAQDSSDYKELILRLYNLNKEKKTGIRFHGYDFERPPCINFLFDKWFAGIKTKNVILKKNIQQLLAIGKMDEDDKKTNKFIINVFDTVKSNFTVLENEYKKILNNDFAVFKSIIFNPIRDHIFNSTRAKYKRDKYITRVMLEKEKQSGLNKSILMIGSGHIIKKHTFTPRFLDKLNAEYRVTFFVNVYKNCDAMFFGRGKKYNSDKKLRKCIKGRKPSEPQITFSLNDNKIIPASRKNIATVLVELYNQ